MRGARLAARRAVASVSLSGSDFRVGEWLVHPSQARIERGAEIVHVTPRAMTVLVYLAHAPGRVVLEKRAPRCSVAGNGGDA